MNIPDNLLYTKEHEWVKIEGNKATVGITEHAAEQLGDIVYVELPSEKEEITKEDTFGSVESVKAVSDCYAPISGKVVETNSLLNDTPALINEDAYGEGWMLKIEFSNKAELDELMNNDEYKKFLEEEGAA